MPSPWHRTTGTPRHPTRSDGGFADISATGLTYHNPRSIRCLLVNGPGETAGTAHSTRADEFPAPDLRIEGGTILTLDAGSEPIETGFNDPLATAGWFATGLDVSTVIVAGSVVIEDGASTRVGEAEVRANGLAATRAVIARL